MSPENVCCLIYIMSIADGPKHALGNSFLQSLGVWCSNGINVTETDNRFNSFPQSNFFSPSLSTELKSPCFLPPFMVLHLALLMQLSFPDRMS